MGGKPTDTLALIFYVERKGDASEAIPPTIAFTPAGHTHPVELPTDVIQTPRVDPAG